MYNKTRKLLTKNDGWILVLGLGVTVRLLLMPITWHNDAVWAPWMAHLLAEGHLNVYQTLFEQFGDTVLTPTVWAPYLPLYYYVMGVWTGLLEALHIVDIGMWTFSYTGWVIENFPRAVFFMKLPYLIVDLAIWGVIMSMIAPERRVLFSWLYLFFPSQIWVSSIMGQNDTLPTLLVVLALYFAAHSFASGRFSQAVIATAALGVGAAFKMYPMFLLVPTAIVLGRSTRKIIVLVTAGVLPFLIIIAPFLGTPAFVEGALFNREGMSLLNMTFGSGLHTAPVFLVLYGLLLSFLLFGTYRRSLRTLRLVYVGTLSLLFIVSSWPFNWLVWLIPYLSWSVVEDNVPDVLYAVVGLFFSVLLTQWGKLVGGYTFYPLGQPLRYFTGFEQLVGARIDLTRIQHFFFAAFVVALISILALAIWRRDAAQDLNLSLGFWSAIVPTTFMLCLLLGATWTGGRSYVVRDQSRTSGDPLPLANGDTIEQTLEMDVGGLAAVDVWVSGPLPVDVNGELQLRGWSESVTIPSVVIPLVDLAPDTMNRFELAGIYPADQYTFELSWHGDQQLWLERSSGDSLPAASLTINGNVTEQDLTIRTIVHSSPSSVMRMALQRLGHDWGFTGSWLLSLLAASLLTLRHLLRRTL